MSVTEGQIRGKCHQDTNVPRSNQAISQIHKNIERPAAYTIASWPMSDIVYEKYKAGEIYPEDIGVCFETALIRWEESGALMCKANIAKYL